MLAASPDRSLAVKNTTLNAYARRVDAVIALLQATIARGDDLPGLAELAATAHFSRFHFHRIWRALTGETVGATVARLRMARALHLLAEPGAAITAIALAAGYETPEAFARAFREITDASPSELRGDAGRLALARDRLDGRRAAARAPAALRVDVVSVEPFEVVALRNRGAFDGLDQAYARLFAWAGEAGLVESIVGLHGVPHGDHRDLPPEQYEFDCGIRLAVPADPPAPARVLRIGGGDYARARHLGAYRDLEALVDAVLAEWLPESGHALRDAPIHFDFLDDPEVVPEALLRADAFVPVVPVAELPAHA